MRKVVLQSDTTIYNLVNVGGRLMSVAAVLEAGTEIEVDLGSAEMYAFDHDDHCFAPAVAFPDTDKPVPCFVKKADFPVAVSN